MNIFFSIKRIIFIIIFVLNAVLTPHIMHTNSDIEFDIPYTKHVLKNGLKLIIHEDHKAPIVAIHVSYHVGSKNEGLGTKGYAHLMEHIMVSGSKNHDEEWFKTIKALGATSSNAFTDFDHTDFIETVPISALDSIFCLESDRMGHLLDALNQKKLDKNKRIVINEVNQLLDEPYGEADWQFWKYLFPRNIHPYSWPVIGSIKDIENATLDSVKEWFRTHYYPSNAVLVIAGDVKSETVKTKVEKYFGNIPPGAPIIKPIEWVGKTYEDIRVVLEDNVANRRITMMWKIPQWGSKSGNLLSLTADIMTSERSSRLGNRLVTEENLATKVTSSVELLEMCGVFTIQALINNGVDVQKVEDIIKEEIASFIKEGPSEKELKRGKAMYLSRFTRSAERIGGIFGKAQILALGEILRNNPAQYKENIRIIQQASAEDVQNVAEEWLSQSIFIQEVQPEPEYQANEREIDRTKMPKPGEIPMVKLPKLQRSTLDNGLEIILVERLSIPFIRFNLLLNAGYASDIFDKPGTQSLTLSMLNKGTKSRSMQQISEELELLGSSLNVGANLDFSSISMSCLKSNLENSLKIFADVLLNPVFPSEQFNLLKQARLTSIAQEKTQVLSRALRVLPCILFGKDHAYGIPFSGTGKSESVLSITQEDIKKFYETWFRPNNATIIVVGDTNMDEIKLKLNEVFNRWSPRDIPEIKISTTEQKNKSVVYLMDRPNSSQCGIIAAQLINPRDETKEAAIDIAHSVLAGSSTKSRIGMNLRENKNWSYMTFSFIVPTKGQRYYVIYSLVQTDKTAESINEIIKEIRGFVGDSPINQLEFENAKKGLTLTFPGELETSSDIISKLVPIIRFGLPSDYYDHHVKRVNKLTLDEVVLVSKEIFQPNSLVWIVVGDGTKIEEKIKQLDIGEVIPIDDKGNPIKLLKTN